MKKILFPTDFSPTAVNAFEYAVELAKALEARITVMTVYHLPLNDASRVPPDYIQQMLQEKKQEVLSKIESFSEAAPLNVLDEPRADYGLFIAQEVADAAQQSAYDLIVMGTKGQHNPIEKILGTVTTQTMMQAPCPVLAIPKEAFFHKISRIAYATDYRPTDEHAVENLMDFASRLKAAVYFVHINTEGNSPLPEEEKTLAGFPDAFAEFSVINNPSLLEGVDSFVKRKQIDLLALFIPRRRLWERLFHNSFTKKMTFHTQMPLLVFRG